MFVAYHFKTIFEENRVVHNYKTGSWQDEMVEDNNWIEGPGIYDFSLFSIFVI